VKNLYYRSIMLSHDGQLIGNLTVGDYVKYRDRYWWIRSICKPKGDPPPRQLWATSICLVPVPDLPKEPSPHLPEACRAKAKELKDRPDWDIELDWLDEGGQPCSLSEGDVPPDPPRCVDVYKIMQELDTCKATLTKMLKHMGVELPKEGDVPCGS
jgi:hypothetical protein